MKRSKKLIILILIVILIGLISVIAGTLFLGENSELSKGDKYILVCAIDESETREGMGACDMAFIVQLHDGSLVNYTPIYPGGMTHPTQPASSALGGGKMFLHDSLYDGIEEGMHDAFWSPDNEQGMQYAREIVEYNTNTSIDAVVAINSEALDAILQAAGPLEINGETVNASGIDIIREEDWGNGVSRGDAVLEIVKAAANKAKDPAIKSSMVNAALDQYSKGNIIMDQQDAFVGLLASKGIETFFD